MSVWKGKYGPLLIAEIGGNHEGDFEYAKVLTQLAVESEADYIKFQIYTGDSIVNPEVSPERNAHFKKFELTPDQHIALAEICHSGDKGYMASVWDMNAFDWIDPYIKIYKIGSGDLTANPFIKKIASYGKPIIISTGLADMDEIGSAIAYLKSVNPYYMQKDSLALLQCTSMYPIPASDANLNAMKAFKEKTGHIIGYSDHTEGSFALILSYALGAEVLEFHFTDTRENKSFRDHKVSLTKDEVKELSDKIKLIDDLRGAGEKKPLDIEADHIISFRRGTYPRRDIPKGTILQADDLHVLRPNTGIGAQHFDRLIGKRAKIDLKKNQKLDWSYFEE
jgi:N-acetylneuraminate synthase/N,N'-diacetyllegionaminate synthase